MLCYINYIIYRSPAARLPRAAAMALLDVAPEVAAALEAKHTSIWWTTYTDK